MTVAEGPHFAQKTAPADGDTALLFGPGLNPSAGVFADEAIPLAALSATAMRLAGTLTLPGPPSKLKKMPALVPDGWALVLRGGASVAVGSLALAARELPLASLITVVASYAMVDGACALFGGLRTTRASERWWPLLLEGLVGVGLGAQALLWRGFDEATLLYYVALWSLISGALELAAARRLREEIAGEWLLALRGLAAIGLGALLFFGGRAGGAGVLFWLGPAATMFGGLFVALGLRLRAWDVLPTYDRSRRIYNV